MDIYTLLVISHIIGTVLGVGAATFAEIFFVKAIKDGEIDPTESSFLKVVYRVIRIGLIILVLSGFGFLLIYRLEGNEQYLYNQVFWAKISVILILLVNAILIQIRKIPMWLGASISITSWYTALILGIIRSEPYTFIQIIIVYVISILVVAFVLEKIKKIYLQKQT